MRTQRHLRELGIVFLAAAMLGWNSRVTAGETVRSADHGFSAIAPDGWVAIPHDLLEQCMAFLGGGAGGPQRMHWVAGYQRPAADWFRYPNQFIGYMEYPGGIQPSDDQIAEFVNAMMGVDIHDVMKHTNSSIMSKIALGEKVESIDWRSDKHELQITMHVSVATWGLIKEYNTLYFGKKNAVFLCSCATDDQYDALLPTFQKSADSFNFDPEFAYDTSVATAADQSLDLMDKVGLVCIVALFAGAWFIWKVANIRPNTAVPTSPTTSLPALNPALPPMLPLPTPPPAPAPTT